MSKTRPAMSHEAWQRFKKNARVASRYAKVGGRYLRYGAPPLEYPSHFRGKKGYECLGSPMGGVR